MLQRSKAKTAWLSKDPWEKETTEEKREEVLRPRGTGPARQGQRKQDKKWITAAILTALILNPAQTDAASALVEMPHHSVFPP